MRSWLCQGSQQAPFLPPVPQALTPAEQEETRSIVLTICCYFCRDEHNQDVCPLLACALPRNNSDFHSRDMVQGDTQHEGAGRACPKNSSGSQEIWLCSAQGQLQAMVQPWHKTKTKELSLPKPWWEKIWTWHLLEENTVLVGKIRLSHHLSWGWWLSDPQQCWSQLPHRGMEKETAGETCELCSVDTATQTLLLWKYLHYSSFCPRKECCQLCWCLLNSRNTAPSSRRRNRGNAERVLSGAITAFCT